MANVFDTKSTNYCWSSVKGLTCRKLNRPLWAVKGKASVGSALSVYHTSYRLMTVGSALSVYPTSYRLMTVFDWRTPENLLWTITTSGDEESLDAFLRKKNSFLNAQSNAFDYFKQRDISLTRCRTKKNASWHLTSILKWDLNNARNRTPMTKYSSPWKFIKRLAYFHQLSAVQKTSMK